MSKSYYFVCLSFLLIVSDVGRCTANYVFHEDAGGSLKLYIIPATWEKAFLKCQSDGAVLASPLNKDLANALHSQIYFYREDARFYLGTKAYFASVEGVPLSEMNVTWGPNGNVQDTADCLTMGVDGSVYYSTCRDPLPYICYKKSDNKTMNDSGTFDNGAVLASPLNKDLANALQSQISSYKEDARFYLGTKAYFAPVEGVPLSDMNVTWGPNGNVQDTADCLTMGVDGSVYYSSCRDPLRYICYKKPVNKTMNDSGTFDNGIARCTANYVFHEDASGSLKLYVIPATWEEAFLKCQNDGAVLASPLNKELANALHSQISFYREDARIYLGTKAYFASVEGVPLSDMNVTWGPKQ